MPYEVQFKTENGYVVKFAGEAKEIFEQQAKFEEIFCNNLVCKNCGGDSTRLNVREDKESNKYYERVCNKCYYSFSFGQKKKGGTLFPKGSKGWTKYSPTASEDDGDEVSAKPTPKGAKK